MDLVITEHFQNSIGNRDVYYLTVLCLRFFLLYNDIIVNIYSIGLGKSFFTIYLSLSIQ